MRLIKVAAAALNQTPLDWDGNSARIVEALRRAHDEGVSVLCLPELCITGYGCEDAFHSPALRRMALTVLQELAPSSRGMVAAVGLPLLYNNAVFNTVAVLVDGRVAGFVAKQNLAGEGLHYEPRWFKPWPAGVRATVEFDGEEVPIGDLSFDVGGVKIGFEICEDAWVAGRPGVSLSARGVDLLLNPSASHFAFGKYATRKGFVAEGSRAFGVTYVYANLLGNEAGRAIYDGGSLIASAGEIVAQGPRFGFEDVVLTSATVDVDRSRRVQASTSSFRPLIGTDPLRVEAPLHLAPAKPSAGEPSGEPWETGPWLEQEEFARAIALALFDYARKSRSRGFVVSLSGGADSSAVSCLVALMVRFGCRALGVDGFSARLGLPELATSSPDALVSRLLTCAYQPTENSGEVTRSAARDLAGALGARFLEIDVSDIVSGYVARVQEALGRTLTWEQDDLALQNIQARARGPSVWMLANIENALLLSTSNRSECSVGYATMDGDTCGGLSPVAGINKVWLREWLVWLERTGPEGLSPVPALRAVNVQAPTAELRPPGSGQTDEGDLMPYAVLDAIERALVSEKLAPAEALAAVHPQFPDVDKATVARWVEGFYRLWCRSQWKRERYAPTFHVDDESVDPKTWCRFPILSGGFERELGALRASSPGGEETDGD